MVFNSTYLILNTSVKGHKKGQCSQNMQALIGRDQLVLGVAGINSLELKEL